VHQVCRKCGQFCPHFNKIVHTFRPIGTLFTYTVHVTAHIYCSCILFTIALQVWTFVQIVHTFWGKVYCSYKTLFTHLTESVDKIVHTFIKLSTLLSERVHCSRKTLFTYLTESVDKLVHSFIKLSTLSGDEFYCSRLKCSYG
jgi:hypothetical protein